MTHDIFVSAAVPLMVPLFFMGLAMVILASLTYYVEMTYTYSCGAPLTYQQPPPTLAT